MKKPVISPLNKHYISIYLNLQKLKTPPSNRQPPKQIYPLKYSLSCHTLLPQTELWTVELLPSL